MSQPPQHGMTKAQRRKLLAIIVVTDLLVVGALLYHFLFRVPATP